jgi:hypothetical protein
MYNPYKPQCYFQFISSQELCKNVVPKSGLYIENLSGMSSQMVSNSTNSNNRTGADNLEDRVFSAIMQAKTILRNYINSQGWLFRSAGQMQSFCSFSNIYHPAIGTAKKGLVITKQSNVAKYNSLYIDSLCVLSNYTGTHTIQLLDNSQNQIQSLSVDLIAGEKSKIPVKWNLMLQNNESYFIVWDTALAQPANGSCSCNTSGCCGNSYSYFDQKSVWYQIKGWDGQKCQNNAFGISINAQVKCDIDNLMCDLLGDIGYSILKLTGAELALAALSPQRTNSANVNSAEWYAAMRGEWLAGAEIEIQNAAAQKVQQWAKEDTFCLYRNNANIAYIGNSLTPHTAARDLQAAQSYAQEQIMQQFAKPLLDYYQNLPIQYPEIYGLQPMFWGFNLF